MIQDTAADGRVEARPCPFCGERPTAEECAGPYRKSGLISCENEDCNAGPTVTGSTLKIAIEKWNGPASLASAAGDPTSTRLRALSNAASPGLWKDDTYRDEDGDCRYDARQAINQDGRTLFDTSNSEVKLIEHDYDGEGLGSSWDEQGARDITFAVALVNAYRFGQLVASVDRTQVPADGGADKLEEVERLRAHSSPAVRAGDDEGGATC